MTIRSHLTRKLFTAYVVIASLVLVMAFGLWQLFLDAARLELEGERIATVMRHISTIREATLQVESITRGYLISGDKTQLTARAPVLEARTQAIQALTTLMADNPRQRDRLLVLVGLMEERRALAARSIDLRETQGFEAARANSLVADVSGSRARYLSVLAEIREEELARSLAVEKSHQRTNRQFMGAFLLILVSLAGLLGWVWRLIRQQIQADDAQLALERARHAMEVDKVAAEQASEAKDIFLATMSHEIRTPMSGMLGMLELLSHSRLDLNQIETLDTARDAGRSLVRIIDDILDHSKIQAGKLDIVTEPVSLAHVLARVRSTYAAMGNHKGVMLRHWVDSRLSPQLMTDRLRVVQVLGNFVSNAIKFSSAGVVELGADVISSEAGFQTVRLSVKDQGIGMSPELQRRLFQPFEQAGVETARMYGGTGLGLAISRKLAEMMGGDVSLVSTPGSGTTISLILKLAEASSDGSPVAPMSGVSAVREPVSRPVLAGATTAGPWVLAVDDNPTSRQLIERQLLLLGMRVRLVEQGDEAFTLWQTGQYALVITDSNMPGMNGYDLTRAIRQAEAEQGRQRTPVLGWTANAMFITQARCKEAGMDDVLIKPADLGQLRSLLTQWLPSSAVVARPAPAIDVARMQEAFGDDKVKLLKTLPAIRKALHEQVVAVRAALQAADLSAVKALSHNMCGSAGILGATTLLDLCVRLEAMSDQADIAALPALSRLFNTEAQRVLDMIDALG